jgi:AcrR family transcriptional regulator
MAPRARRSQEASTAADILGAFTSLVAEHGVTNITLGDIGARLGLSRADILQQYPSKQRLMAAQQSAFMQQRLREQQQIEAALPRPDERFAALIFASIRTYLVDDVAARAVHRLFPWVLESDDMAPVRRLRQRYVSVFRASVVAGIQDGTFFAADPNVVMMHSVGALLWMWTWFRPASEDETMSMGSQVARLQLPGILVDRDSVEPLSDPDGRPARAAAAVVARTSFAV